MRNLRKIIALTCVVTMACTSVNAYASSSSTNGSSVVENNAAEDPDYQEVSLPTYGENDSTYDFTIDTEGLLKQFDTEGAYDSASNVYFNAVATPGAITVSGGSLVQKTQVVDTNLTKLKNQVASGTAIVASQFAEDTFYVWSPDTTSSNTIKAGKGKYVPVTAATLKDYVDGFEDGKPVSGLTLKAANLKATDVNATNVWDGNLYYMGYKDISATDAVTKYGVSLDGNDVKIAKTTPALYKHIGDDYSPVTITGGSITDTDLKFAADEAQHINTSDVAKIENESTHAIAVSAKVSVTTGSGLTYVDSNSFTGVTSASIYMAIESGSNKKALKTEDGATSVTAYYVLGEANNTVRTYQTTATEASTGSHVYKKYEEPNPTYESVDFTITAAVNGNDDAATKASWTKYVKALKDGSAVKPTINIVYSFTNVAKDSESGVYKDASENAYGTAKGWTTKTEAGREPRGIVESSYNFSMAQSSVPDVINLDYGLGNKAVNVTSIKAVIYYGGGTRSFTESAFDLSDTQYGATIDIANKKITFAHNTFVSKAAVGNFQLGVMFNNDSNYVYWIDFKCAAAN